MRDLRHAGPVRAEGEAPLRELVKGITILWREPRVTAGAFVRLVNTAPNFALFVVAPLFFTHTIGFSQGEYLLLVTCVYTANIFANLVFGIVGDRFGWRRTVTWFSCVMCAAGALLLYYVPLALGPNFAVALLCWAVYGIGLAGFVPLTALMPESDSGSALAIYTLAAGLSAFAGPALVGLLGGSAHMDRAIWAFVALYLAAALVSLTLKSTVDPGVFPKPPAAPRDTHIGRKLRLTAARRPTSNPLGGTQVKMRSSGQRMQTHVCWLGMPRPNALPACTTQRAEAQGTDQAHRTHD